jgi:hypothetical protein
VAEAVELYLDAGTLRLVGDPLRAGTVRLRVTRGQDGGGG